MNVFAIQFDVAWEDKAENFVRVRTALDQAETPPGSLIVLPEMFSTGFSLDSQKTRQGEPPEAEQFLAQLAQERQSAVMGGVVALHQGRPRNEAVAFGPHGQCLARYAKIHPFSFAEEEKWYAAGEEIVTFDWQGFRVAPFVCYDLRFPEIFRSAVDQGATLLVVVAQWPAARAEHWATLLSARAIENQAFVVGVNRAGRDPSRIYHGGSRVVDPRGVLRAQAGSGVEVLQAEIAVDEVEAWRAEFPALRDRRRWTGAAASASRNGGVR